VATVDRIVASVVAIFLTWQISSANAVWDAVKVRVFPATVSRVFVVAAKRNGLLASVACVGCGSCVDRFWVGRGLGRGLGRGAGTASGKRDG
jgi:hypothetical protein